MAVSPLYAQVETLPSTAPATAPAEAALRDQITLSPIVRRLIDDPVVQEAERRKLRLFHGQWEGLEHLSVEEQAALALLRFDLDAPALHDEQVDALIRAEAALYRGEPTATLALLQADAGNSAQAALLCALAHEQLGQLAEAVAVLQPWRDRLRREPMNDAAELTAAARGMAELARLEGRPAQDYQLVMNLLARVSQELDPLYWPAQLAEAELLLDKDNAPEAVEALLATLTLNPACGQAWYELGRLSARGFDFDRATAAGEELRRIHADHLLATLLEAHTCLVQLDPKSARATVTAGLERYPNHRELIALLAAAEALAYDEPARQAALDRFEALAPRSPLAHYWVGVYLSLARQYEAGEAALREAIARQPNWPAPRIELGLLLMQAGDNDAAQRELAQAARLDPFNRQANNQLALVDALLGYARIETEHFIIKYKPGIDEVLARDMPTMLEEIYREVTAAFGHQPTAKTQIDLMPDEQWFGVRITGMPEIWTIAASTGDVIALTPPRVGPRQRGVFDWANVVRHEFVHTVTLSKTHNRLPHWFTEACAVSQELTGRSYDTCQLLAWALQADELFALDKINWGFVRPKTPRDRPLAYAQAHWMLEYITHRFGHRAVLDLLALYGEGVGDVAALHRVTGQSAEQFMADFKQWAQGEVKRWGLARTPLPASLQAMLAEGFESVSDEALTQLLAEHPGHPDVLNAIAVRAVERAAEGGDGRAARQAVLRYAAARPVDPWAHRALVTLALQAEQPGEAVASLEALDEQEVYHGDWAHQLAQIHRAAGRLDAAAEAIGRALRRAPYHAGYRELAATIALQQGKLDEALHQLEALAMLEPGRAVHQTRLAAMYARMGRSEEAAAAARSAREIDPRAPVERFLGGAK